MEVDFMAVKIFNTNSNTLLSGTSGKDTIQNGLNTGLYDGTEQISGGSNVTINSGAGDDSIHASCKDEQGAFISNILINSGTGNDFIDQFDVVMGTINAGNGNDTIKNRWSDYITINGGNGKDCIDNWCGSYVTMNGGVGNNVIWGNNSYLPCHSA